MPPPALQLNVYTNFQLNDTVISEQFPYLSMPQDFVANYQPGKETCFLNGQPQPLFRLFSVFSSKYQYNFFTTNQSEKCHVHPVYGTGIRTLSPITTRPRLPPEETCFKVKSLSPNRNNSNSRLTTVSVATKKQLTITLKDKFIHCP